METPCTWSRVRLLQEHLVLPQQPLKLPLHLLLLTQLPEPSSNHLQQTPSQLSAEWVEWVALAAWAA